MRMRDRLLIGTIVAAGFLLAAGPLTLPTQAQTPAALTGQVSSAEEGAMEGVVVSAKKDGSTISISVVTDAQGRFAFPAARLEPGHYTLKARAAGYELDGREAADVAAGQEAKSRHQAQEGEKPLRASHQCRMADEHAGHGRAEALPAQLQRLPHARAHHEVDVRRRRLPGNLPADERLLSRQHAAEAAAARRHCDARSSNAAATAGRPRNGSPASI